MKHSYPYNCSRYIAGRRRDDPSHLQHHVQRQGNGGEAHDGALEGGGSGGRDRGRDAASGSIRVRGRDIGGLLAGGASLAGDLGLGRHRGEGHVGGRVGA